MPGSPVGLSRSATPGGPFERIDFENRTDAEAFLSNLAECISEVRFLGEKRSFRMSYRGGSIGHIDLHQGRYPPVSFKARRARELHIVLPHMGSVAMSLGGVTMTATAGHSILLLPPDHEGRAEASDGGSGISLVVTERAIRDHAAKLAGDETSPRSEPSMLALSTSDPVAATLARNITNVFNEIQSLSRVGLSRLATATLDELLLELACTALYPSLRRKLLAASDEATTPSHARAANDYIRAHAAEPIVLADLARRLGVGMRTLQIGFRREYGTSLREHLLTCRLELARSRLLAGRPGATVAGIALDAGFTDLSVFARRYRDAYGELPSTTLRRAAAD
jgi:AraC-like DNA-binding protein